MSSSWLCATTFSDHPRVVNKCSVCDWSGDAKASEALASLESQETIPGDDAEAQRMACASNALRVTEMLAQSPDTPTPPDLTPASAALLKRVGSCPIFGNQATGKTECTKQKKTPVKSKGGKKKGKQVGKKKSKGKKGIKQRKSKTVVKQSLKATAPVAARVDPSTSATNAQMGKQPAQAAQKPVATPVRAVLQQPTLQAAKAEMQLPTRVAKVEPVYSPAVPPSDPATPAAPLASPTSVDMLLNRASTAEMLTAHDAPEVASVPRQPLTRETLVMKAAEHLDEDKKLRCKERRNQKMRFFRSLESQKLNLGVQLICYIFKHTWARSWFNYPNPCVHACSIVAIQGPNSPPEVRAMAVRARAGL